MGQRGKDTGWGAVRARPLPAAGGAAPPGGCRAPCSRCRLLPDAGLAAAQEAPRLGALDAIQRPALHPRVVHVAVRLPAELGGGGGSASAGPEAAPPPCPPLSPVTGPEAAAHLDAAVPQLLLRRGVAAVVHGLLALHELLGAAGRDGTGPSGAAGNGLRGPGLTGPALRGPARPEGTRPGLSLSLIHI